MEPKNLSRITMFVVFIFLVVTCNMIEMTPTLIEVLPRMTKCTRHRRDINQCIKNSIESLRPYLANGIPGLNTESFEPYRMTLFEFPLRNEYKGIVRFQNISIYGLANYTAIGTQISLDMSQIEFVALYPRIRVLAHYDIQSPDLPLPKTIDGYQMWHNYINVKVGVLLRGEYYMNNKVLEEYFRVNLLLVKQLSAEKSNNYRDMPTSVSQQTYYALNKVWYTIEKEMPMLIRRKVAEVIYNFANKIYDNFPTRILFPL